MLLFYASRSAFGLFSNRIADVSRNLQHLQSIVEISVSLGRTNKVDDTVNSAFKCAPLFAFQLAFALAVQTTCCR